MKLSWNWEDIWIGVGLLAVLSVATILGCCIFADHKPQMYYLTSSTFSTVCVAVSVQWDQDFTVYCSDDRDRAIEFMKKANQALKEAK